MISIDDFWIIYNSAEIHNQRIRVLVDSSIGEVFVPRESVDENGCILLDITKTMVKNLIIDEEKHVKFLASFEPGKLLVISFPLENIVDIGVF